MSNLDKNHKNNKEYKRTVVSFLVVVGVVLVFIGFKALGNKNSTETPSGGSNKGTSVLSDAGDLIIPVSEVSSTATFYPVEIDGTTMEVLAVKASDGTIRTAFNTCQICYSSGRGYYEQNGDVLVCQNCGNQFNISEVEVARGGCNPVPIFSENKTEDENNITISKAYLTEAKEIFANWKTSY